jgi:hypothetical protein
MMNWKGYGRKWSFSDRGTVATYAWRDRVKPRNISARITEITTEHLPDVSVEFCF